MKLIIRTFVAFASGVAAGFIALLIADGLKGENLVLAMGLIVFLLTAIFIFRNISLIDINNSDNPAQVRDNIYPNGREDDARWTQWLKAYAEEQAKQERADAQGMQAEQATRE